MNFLQKLSCLLIFIMVLASCRSQSLIRPGDSLDVAYEKAYSLYEDERWRDAINAFETVLSIGRGTDIGQDAQFYLAESYYNSNQFLLAASEYERYSSSHPSSSRREHADFRAAHSYYQMSPRYKVDQSNSRQAIERFRLFLARYPNSERAEEATDIIEELRDKLAQKTYESGHFYMRTGSFRAAAIYFDLVLDRYPETAWAERALVDQIDAYLQYADNSIPSRREERYRMAMDSYETYLQLFPRGENRSRAEELYDDVRDALDQYESGDEPVSHLD